MALRTENRNIGPTSGLSLCAGYAGLDLGLSIAEPGFKTVGFVERQTHAAATLVARMEDKSLHPAPIWDDLTTFDGNQWRGKVDCILAGYPCQPFSTAGKKLAEADPRHLWPHVARIIKETGASWAFLENVEGHLDRGFFSVASELQKMGYAIQAGLFSAYEVGAPHWRRRIFVLAYSNSVKGQRVRHQAGQQRDDIHVTNGIWTDTSGRGIKELDSSLALHESGRMESGTTFEEIPLFAPAPFDYQAWEKVLTTKPDLQPWLHGLDHGVARGMDRSHAAGNGVVSLAAAHAWRTLKTRMFDA